jgi:hypothetical protein
MAMCAPTPTPTPTPTPAHPPCRPATCLRSYPTPTPTPTPAHPPCRPATCLRSYGIIVLVIEIISSTATFGYAILLVKYSQSRRTKGEPTRRPGGWAGCQQQMEPCSSFQVLVPGAGPLHACTHPSHGGQGRAHAHPHAPHVPIQVCRWPRRTTHPTWTISSSTSACWYPATRSPRSWWVAALRRGRGGGAAAGAVAATQLPCASQGTSAFPAATQQLPGTQSHTLSWPPG